LTSRIAPVWGSISNTMAECRPNIFWKVCSPGTEPVLFFREGFLAIVKLFLVSTALIQSSIEQALNISINTLLVELILQ